MKNWVINQWAKGTHGARAVVLTAGMSILVAGYFIGKAIVKLVKGKSNKY